MRSDFAAYAEARWPALVAFLVDEGVEREQAEEQATEGLARCRRRWRELQDDHDLDAQVLAVVTGSGDRALADRFLTSLEVERDHDELPRREPPVVEIQDRARAAGRRTTVRWLAGTLVVVLLAVGAWLVTGPMADDDERPATNPLPVAWYFEGELHLADRIVRTPRLNRLVSVVDGGVVYVSAEGQVALVAADGHTDNLGRTSPDKQVAVDQDGDRVAWATAGAASSDLYVYDVLDGRVTSTRPLPDQHSEPIAIDGGSVFFRTASGTYVWTAADHGEGSTTQVVNTLLDSAAGASVNQLGKGELQVIRSFTPVLTLPGEGGDLSRDGRRLLTLEPGAFAQPVAYDAVFGRRLRLGLPRSQYILGGAFGPAGTFVFAVRHDANEHRPDESLRLSTSGPILLVVCHPDVLQRCRTVTQLADDTAYPPVLAQ